MTEVFAWRNAAAAAKRRPQQAGDIFTGSQGRTSVGLRLGRAVAPRTIRLKAGRAVTFYLLATDHDL